MEEGVATFYKSKMQSNVDELHSKSYFNKNQDEEILDKGYKYISYDS